MAAAEPKAHPPRMDEVANELARLLAKEHRRVAQERAGRETAEEAAAQLAVLLEREHRAREQAEAQARELSTLILGDKPPRPPTRFIPARTRLHRVS